MGSLVQWKKMPSNLTIIKGEHVKMKIFIVTNFSQWPSLPIDKHILEWLEFACQQLKSLIFKEIIFLFRGAKVHEKLENDTDIERTQIINRMKQIKVNLSKLTHFIIFEKFHHKVLICRKSPIQTRVLELFYFLWIRMITRFLWKPHKHKNHILDAIGFHGVISGFMS